MVHTGATGLLRSRKIHLCFLRSFVNKIGSYLHIFVLVYIKTHVIIALLVNELYTRLWITKVIKRLSFHQPFTKENVIASSNTGEGNDGFCKCF